MNCKVLILFLLLAFCNSFAQDIGSVLEKTGWPTNVQSEVKSLTNSTAGQTVRIYISRTMDGGIINNVFRNSPVIDIGSVATFWFYQKDQVKALLVKSGNNWYWQSEGLNLAPCNDSNYVSSELPLSEGRSAKHSVNSSYSVNLEFGYYGQNGIGFVTASRSIGMARYWENHVWQNCLFDLSAGWGADVGGGLFYRPSRANIKLSEAIPMGIVRLHGFLDAWIIKLYGNLGYVYSWEQNYNNNYLEGFAKAKISLSKPIKLVIDYYGARGSVDNWIYNEGRLGLIYQFKENYFIGFQTGLMSYLDGQYSNHLDPKPGGIVAGYHDDKIFLEASVGQYHQIDATNKIRTKEADVIKFQLACNIRIIEF